MQEFYQNLSTKDIEGLENINKEEKNSGGIGNVIKGLMSTKEGEGGIGGVIKGMMGGKEGGIGGMLDGLIGGNGEGKNIIGDLMGSVNKLKDESDNQITDSTMNEVD